MNYAERLDFLRRYDDVDVRADMATCYECKRCGALTRDTDKHDAWHGPYGTVTMGRSGALERFGRETPVGWTDGSLPEEYEPPSAAVQSTEGQMWPVDPAMVLDALVCLHYLGRLGNKRCGECRPCLMAALIDGDADG